MSNPNDLNSSFQEESYWSKAWVRHLKQYLASAPRCGYWIESQLSKKSKILEIAGGSCRDSRYLSGKGYNATGSDFDQKTLDYLEKNYPINNFTLSREDAFKFSFQDNEFDESFSNGFWVCFDNDEDIHVLIKEQARVTKKHLISLVHNVENKKLVERFKRKSIDDDLYKIRFFHKDELVKLLKASNISYKSIKVVKFGGPMDLLLARKIENKSLMLHHFFRKIVLKFYKYQPWSMVERIAVIVELE